MCDIIFGRGSRPEVGSAEKKLIWEVGEKGGSLCLFVVSWCSGFFLQLSVSLVLSGLFLLLSVSSSLLSESRMISPRFLLFSIFLLSTIIDITSGLECYKSSGFIYTDDYKMPTGTMKGCKSCVKFDGDESVGLGIAKVTKEGNWYACGHKTVGQLKLGDYEHQTCAELGTKDGGEKDFKEANSDGSLYCCETDKCNGGMGMFPRIGVLALALTLGGILTLHASLQ